MKYIYRLLYIPARLYWFIARPTAKGAGIIIEKDNHLLMVRHTYGDRKIWHFPGGGSKHGEEEAHTAQRELLEELGLHISLQKLGNIEAVEYNRLIKGSCYYGYLEDQQVVRDKKEIEEVRWWPAGTLPEMSPTTIKCSKLYFEHKQKMTL